MSTRYVKKFINKKVSVNLLLLRLPIFLRGVSFVYILQINTIINTINYNIVTEKYRIFFQLCFLLFRWIYINEKRSKKIDPTQQQSANGEKVIPLDSMDPAQTTHLWASVQVTIFALHKYLTVQYLKWIIFFNCTFPVDNVTLFLLNEQVSR